MRIGDLPRTLLLCGAALAGAFNVGCGEVPETDAVEKTAAPLLGAPGAFYTVAPDHGFCSNSTMAECHGGYSFNSKGAKPTFLKRAVGLYRVTFENLANGGNVQVSASRSNAHCNVLNTFPSGTGTGIDILCRSPSGAQVDTAYVLSYYRDTNVGGPLGGYATVRNTAPLTVTNAWNSTGAAISAVTMGPGSYRVSFPGQSFSGDNALVTAATSSAAYCTLAGWAAGGGGVSVDVRCFTFAGAPTSADFSLWYGHNVRGEPRNQLPAGTQGALALVGMGGGVDATRSRNSCQAGGNSALLQTNNVYNETYHAVTTFNGEVPLTSLVTSVSTTGAYCNLDHLPVQGVRSDSHGFVTCFTAAGATTAAQHSSHFIIQDHSGC